MNTFFDYHLLDTINNNEFIYTVRVYLKSIDADSQEIEKNLIDSIYAIATRSNKAEDAFFWMMLARGYRVECIASEELSEHLKQLSYDDDNYREIYFYLNKSHESFDIHTM